MVLDGSIDRSLVEDTIPDEPLDLVFDLRQQSRYLGRVLLMAFRQRGGDNPTLRIHTDMQFLPAFVRLFTVVLPENPNQLKCLTFVPVMITLEQPIFL